MLKRSACLVVVLLAVLGPTASARVGAAELLANGGFEDLKDGAPLAWVGLWTRAQDGGTLSIERSGAHGGKRCIRIEHRGAQDWALTHGDAFDVAEGDLFEMEAWIRLEGKGDVAVSVTTRDRNRQVVEWIHGAASAGASKQWRRLASRFVVPSGVATIQPRVTGNGPAVIWVDDVTLRKEGNVTNQRLKNGPPELVVENDAIRVALRTTDGTLAVRDKRVGSTVAQKPFSRDTILTDAALVEGEPRVIRMELLHAPSALKVEATLRLEGGATPEFVISLKAEGVLRGELAFPHPFASEAGTYLVIPMNEGISYPVEDESIRPMRLIAYGGHGICMAFWGATEGESGHMAILETADDAAIRIGRSDGRLQVAPVWESTKGQSGYERRVRYVFFDKGGHVAMCKRYRAYARQIGRLKTLAEKRRENPNVDLLVGAVNVWCWDDPKNYIDEMRSLGIRRVLWSNRQSPDNLRWLNGKSGVLTSRYDIYQDLMDPEIAKTKLRGLHRDWTQEGFPKDIMLDERGKPRSGWQVTGKDGKRYPCAVLCDKRAPDYARRRVSEELKTHPYRCRFIDTTTASPWRECYHPDHPMTRGESRHWKMELLRYMSEEAGLVTGSETGHDASVPFVHYFEGMLSLGHYRVPDAGRDMARIWDEVPERVAKFQVGHRYRLPLWELVYHDCVVAQWYWGDYNNKLPRIWSRRDLFNVLYGTPPMFMFNQRFWQRNKERFSQSFKTIGPVARATGYSEMTDHRFLTPNRDVQQTVFANGVKVTVNFSDDVFNLPGGGVLPPMSHHAAGVRGR